MSARAITMACGWMITHGLLAQSPLDHKLDPAQQTRSWPSPYAHSFATHTLASIFPQQSTTSTLSNGLTSAMVSKAKSYEDVSFGTGDLAKSEFPGDWGGVKLQNATDISAAGERTVSSPFSLPDSEQNSQWIDESSNPLITFKSIGLVPTLASASFAPPAANMCQSSLDQFYKMEAGVYAYWGLCEKGQNANLYDYAGKFDLNLKNGAWFTGTLNGDAPGPLPDQETSVQALTASTSIEAQGIPLNTHAGTIATWVNVDLQPTAVTTLAFFGLKTQAAVFLGTSSQNGQVCFSGNLSNSDGTAFSVAQLNCTPTANVWHRTVLTWSDSLLVLYVDGTYAGSTQRTGSLGSDSFYYRLFPGCCDTGKQMSLAKALISNVAWTSDQVKSDYAPAVVTPPAGGVYVKDDQLGTIHRDVLGFADNNADVSSAPMSTSLRNGLNAAGATSLRYAGGYGGIAADLANWQGGLSCSTTPGATNAAANIKTANILDNYVANISQPLNLHVGYTVNYGTNPPFCNAGGDPQINGANLVHYANTVKNYGIQYWEIGNELYNGGSSETDFHSNPGDGASYAQYEQAFYSAMKAQDASIKIGVPIGEAIYKWQSGWDLPVMANASYDAVVWHNYPIKDPITDGDTLYQDRVASSLRRTRGSLLGVQTELLNVSKDPSAIWVTEWDADVSGDEWSRQSMGAIMPMFTTIQLAEYMQAGVQYATWWAQGMSNSCYDYYYDSNADAAYNWFRCGGSSLVYTGSLPGEFHTGLQAGDLMPAARGMQVLSRSGFVSEGEHMLRTISDDVNSPWLLSYASTHAGSYAVILINRDRDHFHTVPVQLASQASGGQVKQWSYGRAQYDHTYRSDWSRGPISTTAAGWTGTYSATLAPWSVNVLIFTQPGM